MFVDPLKVHRLVLGPLETNCYVVVNEETKEAVVVDPGDHSEALLAAITPYRVTHILLTHAHFDHIGGVEAVKAVTGARLLIHEREEEWLTRPELNGSAAWLESPITAPSPDALLKGGEQLMLLGQEVKVLYTPGHSPGHLSFHWGEFVVSGDALFAGSIGRTDLPGGDYATLMQSIKEKLLTLPKATILLPGHGPASSIEHELEWNPFLT